MIPGLKLMRSTARPAFIPRVSRRWTPEKSGNSPDADNNAKLLRLLKDVPSAKRTARFRCVLALVPTTEVAAQNTSPVCDANEFELQTELFDGTCEGAHCFFALPSGKRRLWLRSLCSFPTALRAVLCRIGRSNEESIEPSRQGPGQTPSAPRHPPTASIEHVDAVEPWPGHFVGIDRQSGAAVADSRLVSTCQLPAAFVRPTPRCW